MFEVEFKLQSILGKIPVSDEIKLYYENIIRLFVKTELDYLNLEKLNKIIVPNDFIQEVLAFQKEKGISRPGVTNTKFAKAFGKMIYSPQEDKYYVFIDADKAVFILEDTMFKCFFSSLEERDYNRCIVERRQAMNLLAHELAHVEFETNVKTNYGSGDLRQQVISLWSQIFEEYYACRRSSKVFGDSSIISHDEDYLSKVELEIMEQRKKYNCKYIELNEFCQLFHDYTRMCLIHVVSELGCVKEKKSSVNYDLLKIGKYVRVLDNEFEYMYTEVCNTRQITISEELINLTFDYFAEFGVFITEMNSGTRYDIPVIYEGGY